MIEVEIDSGMLERAQVRLAEMPRLNNSITSGQAMLHGFVGEEMVASVVNNDLGIFGTMTIVGDFEYDILWVLPDGVEKKVEVKTKRTAVEPKPYYEVSVAKFNTTQQCDLYVFTRVHNDLHKGWILGMIPPTKYYAGARALKKGDTDGDNNFVVKADCWNMPITELNNRIFDIWCPKPKLY